MSGNLVLGAIMDCETIKLQLIDGTYNSIISQALDLQIHFPTGESQNLTFYVTPLDQSCTIGLGYCWLTCYNPSIDWVFGSIFSSNHHSTNPRAHPPSRHLCHWHPFQTLWTLSW